MTFAAYDGTTGSPLAASLWRGLQQKQDAGKSLQQWSLGYSAVSSLLSSPYYHPRQQLTSLLMLDAVPLERILSSKEEAVVPTALASLLTRGMLQSKAPAAGPPRPQQAEEEEGDRTAVASQQSAALETTIALAFLQKWKTALVKGEGEANAASLSMFAYFPFASVASVFTVREAANAEVFVTQCSADGTCGLSCMAIRPLRAGEPIRLFVPEQGILAPTTTPSPLNSNHKKDHRPLSQQEKEEAVERLLLLCFPRRQLASQLMGQLPLPKPTR